VCREIILVSNRYEGAILRYRSNLRRCASSRHETGKSRGNYCKLEADQHINIGQFVDPTMTQISTFHLRCCRHHRGSHAYLHHLWFRNTSACTHLTIPRITKRTIRAHNSHHTKLFITSSAHLKDQNLHILSTGYSSCLL